MLTVYRQDLHALLSGSPHHKLTRNNESFLIRQRDILFCLQGCHRRFKSGKSHHRSHNDIHGRISRCLNERLSAAQNLCRPGIAGPEPRSCSLI